MCIRDRDATVAEATTEPEPTPETTPQYVTLTAGMNDPSVPALQERLMELHYMSQDQPTDFFGPATLMAVQAFQRKNGLDAVSYRHLDVYKRQLHCCNETVKITRRR